MSAKHIKHTTTSSNRGSVYLFIKIHYNATISGDTRPIRDVFWISVASDRRKICRFARFPRVFFCEPGVSWFYVKF